MYKYIIDINFQLFHFYVQHFGKAFFNVIINIYLGGGGWGG